MAFDGISHDCSTPGPPDQWGNHRSAFSKGAGCRNALGWRSITPGPSEGRGIFCSFKLCLYHSFVQKLRRNSTISIRTPEVQPTQHLGITVLTPSTTWGGSCVVPSIDTDSTRARIEPNKFIYKERPASFFLIELILKQLHREAAQERYLQTFTITLV